MAENSKIEWTHHTFNPWRGCTKISPGCANCYAETMSHRNPKTLGEWGPNGVRVIAAESYWRLPLKWNKQAAKAGERHRVFCASLADVFEDRPELIDARKRLFRLIHATAHLDWLLLTKRPENIAKHQELFADEIDTYEAEAFSKVWMRRVWLGVSVENQAAADERIPLLLQCPAAVRFLSVEPLLGRVLMPYCPTGPMIDWVIVGCESGSHRRPMQQEWAESLASQCRAADCAFFMKQMEVNGKVAGEMDSFPTGLRVREFPKAVTDA